MSGVSIVLILIIMSYLVYLSSALKDCEGVVLSIDIIEITTKAYAAGVRKYPTKISSFTSTQERAMLS